jgi:hypothetical protein
MNDESVIFTLYIWFWKLLSFVVIYPGAMVVLMLAVIGCISHFIYITFYKAQEK